MKLTLVAGARPNFIKIAPIIRYIDLVNQNGIKIFYRFIHTGQHYDKNMSDTFFEELNIPLPDINLGCSGGTQAEQTAAIMVAFEKELIKNPADLVLVVGDVNSTMACAIVAKKLNTRVAHVEAGLRSFDLSMPEEINRMVTDCLTDYFFTTSEIANENLKRIGVKPSNIFYVGNVMIDTLLQNRNRFSRPHIFDNLNLKNKEYLIITLHRPANVDESKKLKALIVSIVDNVNDLPVIFPIHPRTAKLFEQLNLKAFNLKIIEPLGYLQFNYLVEHAKAVITDSGGITEETTVLSIPCLTLRNNTERPETVEIGTNELVGTHPENITRYLTKLFSNEWKKGSVPYLWDGKASTRIVNHLLRIYAEKNFSNQ